MLRTKLAALLAAVMLVACTGTSSALLSLAPTSGPVHGTCTFGALSAQAGAGSFTAFGTGSCIANGVVTPGALTIVGQIDVESTCAGVVVGVATLELAAFGQLHASARVVTAATTGTVAMVGDVDAVGTFTALKGYCPAQATWAGALAF